MSSTCEFSARSACWSSTGDVDLRRATPVAVDRGVWLRPFRNLIYVMPPYICTAAEIDQITSAMVEVARVLA